LKSPPTLNGEAATSPNITCPTGFGNAARKCRSFVFEKVGCIPLLEAYRAVVKHLDVDAIVLIDGGTDSLMRGDEAGLGTPEEDIAASPPLNDLDVEKKFLVCLGFGVDSFHGVCHSHAFEAVADLTSQGAFLGAFSLLKEMPEVRQYAEAVAAVSMPCRFSKHRVGLDPVGP